MCLMQGSIRCFFFLSAKHLEALFSSDSAFLSLCLPACLPAYIIKCYFEHGFSSRICIVAIFLLLTPLCCDHHPYCESVQLLLCFKRCNDVSVRKCVICVKNNTFNEPFDCILWCGHDMLRTSLFDTLSWIFLPQTEHFSFLSLS